MTQAVRALRYHNGRQNGVRGEKKRHDRAVHHVQILYAVDAADSFLSGLEPIWKLLVSNDRMRFLVTFSAVVRTLAQPARVSQFDIHLF